MIVEELWWEHADFLRVWMRCGLDWSALAALAALAVLWRGLIGYVPYRERYPTALCFLAGQSPY